MIEFKACCIDFTVYAIDIHGEHYDLNPGARIGSHKDLRYFIRELHKDGAFAQSVAIDLLAATISHQLANT